MLEVPSPDVSEVSKREETPRPWELKNTLQQHMSNKMDKTTPTCILERPRFQYTTTIQRETPRERKTLEFWAEEGKKERHFRLVRVRAGRGREGRRVEGLVRGGLVQWSVPGRGPHPPTLTNTNLTKIWEHTHENPGTLTVHTERLTKVGLAKVEVEHDDQLNWFFRVAQAGGELGVEAGPLQKGSKAFGPGASPSNHQRFGLYPPFHSSMFSFFLQFRTKNPG